MVVASENYRGLEPAFPNGLVECQGNLGAAFAVGIEDACLGAYDKVIPGGLFNPMDVVVHLSLDFLRSIGPDFLQHIGCQLIRESQVGRVLGHAYPAERSESAVEEHRAHNVLNVRRIAEFSIGQENVGAGT